MRAHTLRTAVRFGMMTAALAGVTFAAAPAHAEGDVNTGSSGSSGSSAIGTNTSTGSAAIKYEHTKGLPTSIQTGFKGPSFAQVNVGVKIDPVTNGGPLFAVDMPKGALVEASWGNDKKIVLKAQTGTQTDGLVSVRHTLTPSIDFKFSGFGLSATFSYDANKLVNKIPGARFNFDSKASQPFAPWGFAQVDTKLNAPDLDKAILFSMNMDALPDFVSNNVEGSFGVKATTKPTFSYKTTRIVMSGMDGEIKDGSGELTTTAVDGDFMEVMAAVEGEMSVKGSIGVHPFVHIDKIGDHNITTDLGIDVYNFDYTVPATKTPYQTTLVHIPMPNVHVPTKGVDVGMVKVGGSATKTVKIENSGEKDAVMTFSSSDAAFSVTSETVNVPAKGAYELTVKFSPESAAAAQADIKVLSSDADSPEQMFKIGANGADVGADKEGSEDGDLPKGPAADSGCGCKTTGSTTSTGGWAGLGLAALGAAVFVRRRRNAR